MEQSLKSLASELLTLEVNTILKENTTGAKMPVNKRMALRDIIERYKQTLVEYGVCEIAKGNPPSKDGSGKPKFLLRFKGAGEYSFYEVKRAAHQGKQYYESLLPKMQTEEQLVQLKERIQLLYRIERQSSNFIGMFKLERTKMKIDEHQGLAGYDNEFKAPDNIGEYDPYPSQMGSIKWNNDILLHEMNTVQPLDFDSEQITQIRKAWELGTQQVLLQTVVQIDGDITSYLTPKFVKLPDTLRDMVMNFHQSSTNEATSHWSSFFKVISDLTGKAFSSVFGGNKQA
ncbi:chitin synthase domain-containing protein [Flammeovirga kamogawensis]|uniref:Uncharacterized protein n=1 Tax=Flammeovirga kamogawensis TaxID=373891 RepID=A0ABX8GYQ4_9BACT|nr:hypothetical protein [Flammeovirga kamogawensis]MBB6459180.1 hypothetical protein [Flammeovirga kamogawensis]QWG08746.1 hypothetical protein KM029_07345 [Flammeovirga kamogawensis]TRX67039.1 hypothetical protein EO216_02390 [Flammeovirga kamogawensis]